MVSRKRTRGEVERDNYDTNVKSQEQHTGGAAAAAGAGGSGSGGLLHQLRNMWEFANLMQYIYSFGKVVKVDDNIDIEVCRFTYFSFLFSFLFHCFVC